MHTHSLSSIHTTPRAQDAFRDVPDSVFRNDGLWRQWYDQEAPEVSKVPDYEDRLSKFERMCVVKTFREDRTLIAAADYIADALGQVCWSLAEAGEAKKVGFGVGVRFKK